MFLINKIDDYDHGSEETNSITKSRRTSLDNNEVTLKEPGRCYF